MWRKLEVMKQQNQHDPHIQVIHFFIHLQQQKSHGKEDSSNYVIACCCVVSTVKKYHCNDNNLPKLSFMEFKANKLRPDAFNNPLPSIRSQVLNHSLGNTRVPGRMWHPYDSCCQSNFTISCNFKHLVRYTAPISFRTRRSCPVPQRPSNPQKFNKHLTCHMNCERGAKCS